MTTSATTDGIDRLAARRLPGRGWEVTFRSVNVGMHHQLYVDGELVDWSDTPQQRVFLVDERSAPATVALVATLPDDRQADHAELLDIEHLSCCRIVRLTAPSAASDVVLLGDQGTGGDEFFPLAKRDAHPAWMNRVGFGRGAFGTEGLGFEGGSGAGKGSFGLGQFGLDCLAVRLHATLTQEGLHQVRLRWIGPDGSLVDGPMETVRAHPPPEPAQSITLIAYEAQTQRLTIKVQ